MPKRWLLLFLFTLPIVTYSQQRGQIITQSGCVDSVRSTFYKKADSIKQVYVIKLNTLESELSQESLHQGFVDIPSKTNSLLAEKRAVIQSLEYSIDSLKSQTKGGIQQLNLPVDSEQFSNELESFKLPVGDLPVGDLSEFEFPQLDFTTIDFDLPNLDGSLPSELGQVTAQVSHVDEYGEEIKQMTSGKLEQVQALPAGLEQTLAEKAGVSAFNSGSQAVEDFTKLQNPDQLKQEALDQVQQQAIDHFAGKEEVLTETMAKISKLKKKYSNITSLSEIPKRRPNEMKGKPVIERLLPQVVFQVFTRNEDVLVDWANYVGWRFTGRLTAGAGWNQRVGYSKEANSFHNEKRVYGPRVFAEYKWTKGFKPRLEFEYMRTFLPPHAAGSKQDPVTQQWVGAALIGLKKDYKFFGKVRGTTSIMFRIAGDKYKSPYSDVLNMRFGFDFPMKKKRPMVKQ